MLALALAAGNAAAQEAETAQPQGPKTTELRAVPVEYRAFGAADFFLPIGEAVRADTWDMLAVKPDHPVTLRLACIVMTASGAPGACVDAALLPKGQKTIDWTRMRELSDVADQSATLADLQLRGIANQRIDAALLPARAAPKDLFVIRFFEETIAPADARAPFADGAAP
ncbi:MAG: hypothetical protein J0626_03535, partial [Rhodospirillaceae bacterium]|nr:hypothetical protein [Rhodospirillaceae bacterium]